MRSWNWPSRITEGVSIINSTETNHTVQLPVGEGFLLEPKRKICYDIAKIRRPTVHQILQEIQTEIDEASVGAHDLRISIEVFDTGTIGQTKRKETHTP